MRQYSSVEQGVRISDIATPIQELQNVGNNRLFIQREDLLPFSFGGNKVRIAEKYYEDMQRLGKNCMVAYGNARSNLCRILSNLCFSRNIPCHIIAPFDADGTRIATNNQYLVSQCKAVVHECEKANVHDTVEKVLHDCVARGMSPYYIYGNAYGEGNEAVPVSAYFEIYQKILHEKRFDYIFLPVGTGMTMAGLLAGKLMGGGTERIVGISVARPRELAIAKTKAFVNTFLEARGNNITESIEIVDDYVCNGYGDYHSDIVKIIFEMYCGYGIPLDPVYTGKAFWGLHNYVKKHNIMDAKLLFVHTGGVPLFFDLLCSMQRDVTTNNGLEDVNEK